VLDDVGPRVDSQYGLGVLLPVLTAFTLWTVSTVSTSMFSKRSMIGAVLGSFVFELAGGLDLEGLSVGSEDGLGHLLNLGLLGGFHVNIILGVLGAIAGSGINFLLLYVNLLGLGSHHGHHHGNLLGFGAVGLDNLENVNPSVDGGFGLGVLRCLGSPHDLVLLGTLHVHVVLGSIGPRGLGVTLSSTQASLVHFLECITK
jgi:hypothetical protein